MNAVGIDVPKGKSTVAILRPMGEVVQAPIDVLTMRSAWNGWRIRFLLWGENTRVVMEATGRCHSFDPDSHLSGCFISHI